MAREINGKRINLVETKTEFVSSGSRNGSKMEMRIDERINQNLEKNKDWIVKDIKIFMDNDSVYCSLIIYERMRREIK